MANDMGAVLALVVASLQLLLIISLAMVSAEDEFAGFLSISCGATTPFVDSSTNIPWQTDGDFISTGQAGSVDAAVVAPTTSKSLLNLRAFPPESTPTKNCLVVPVALATVYLVRAAFFYGNYDGNNSTSDFHFQISLGANSWQNLTLSGGSSEAGYTWVEAILLTQDPTLSVCLIRTDPGTTPFINSLELRKLPSGSYLQMLAEPSLSILNLVYRYDFGQLSTVPSTRGFTGIRYPDDPYDRFWEGITLTGTEAVKAAGYPNQYIRVTAANQPPAKVLQTAVSGEAIELARPVRTTSLAIYLYCVELLSNDSDVHPRTIDLTFTAISQGQEDPLRVPYQGTLTLEAPFQEYLEPQNWKVLLIPIADNLTLRLTRSYGSNLPPTVSAAEYYDVHNVDQGTNKDDVSSLTSLKAALNLSHWVGDPCLPVSWDELRCINRRPVSLDLSGKEFNGSIPEAIAGLTTLTILNLSNNHFTGPLPSFLSQLTALENLDVSSNELSGNFSSTIFSKTPKLSEFRFRGNDLSCLRQGATPCPGPSMRSLGSHHSSTTTIFIGCLVGGIILLIVLSLLIWWFFYRHKPGGIGSSSFMSGRKMGWCSHDSQANNSGHGKAQRFRATKIKELTKNYKRKIGEGSLGPVYYGVVGEQEVAVKVISETAQPTGMQGYTEFINEIDRLSRVHHKKLVSLVGFCLEPTHLILLYEYIPGGDLRSLLYGDKARSVPLTWRQRLQIAVDAAQGIAYLHSDCKPGIAHLDVKSANILISSTLDAKVADFGLSKFKGEEDKSSVSTAIEETTGYLDPESYTAGALATKSDVFSFGVVLLEIFCGEPPIVSSTSIVDRVQSAVERGDVLGVADPHLAAELGDKVEGAWLFLTTALSCVEYSSANRPDMARVVLELNQVLDMELGEPDAAKELEAHAL